MHPMNDRRVNWSLWTGLALSVIAVASYVLVFYRFPITRDVPWVSYLLFVVALGMLIAGVRRAPGRKIVAFIVATIGVALAVLFTVGIVVGSRVPAPRNPPAARATGRKIVAFIVATIGVALAVLFTVGIVVGSRVPALGNPPAVGAKAPEFTLLDADRKPVALSQMLAAPGAKGVLLVFYRGYW